MKAASLSLYLLRHGIAVERGSPGYATDARRPLTEIGRQKTALVARAIQRLGLEFDRIFSSPYDRARGTAEIVANVLKPAREIEILTSLEPDGAHSELIHDLCSLRPRPHDVLLVGHEPHLSSLIGFLTCGDEDAGIRMRKAGLAKLTVETLTTGPCATLEWLLAPGVIQRLLK